MTRARGGQTAPQMLDPAPVGGRIRVMNVIARLNIGGPALHATLLTERLDPTRYESVLVAGAPGSSEGNFLDLHGRRVDGLVSLPALSREIHGGRDLVALVELVRLMRRLRPQIVHTHTAKAGTLGRLAARLAGVPIVVHTYHGHVFHGYFSARRSRVLITVDRWLARLTDCVLTVSEAVRAELLEAGIGTPERFRVLPYGLDLERFLGSETRRGALRAELGIPREAPLVGIVARLVPVKAHEVFLQAAAGVASRVPQCRFIVVGDGERRDELEQLTTALGLRGRVHFLGWRADLERIYADLDLVALSSLNEGSPFALIEAMAAGRAVVATAVGGVPDLVEHDVTGCLVPAGQPHAMAEAMVGLLASPEQREAMGRRGRARVYPAFDAARLVEDIARLYAELLAGSGRETTFAEHPMTP